MKKLLFIFLFKTVLASAAHTTFYVIAKSGLNLRAEANTTAKVLATVAYGEEVTVLYKRGDIAIDGINGSWCQVKYKDNVGALVDIYLVPTKPPLLNTQSLDDYFTQLSTVAFKTEILKEIRPAEEIEGPSPTLQKTYYKNGMEIHHVVYYEIVGNTYFFPHWSKEKVFVLLKQIKDFNALNDYAITYPTSSKVYKKGNKVMDVKVTTEKIDITYVDKLEYFIVIYEKDNQVMVEFSSGVAKE